MPIGHLHVFFGEISIWVFYPCFFNWVACFSFLFFSFFFFWLLLFCFVLFCLFRAASMAYVSSKVRGQIGAIAAGLHHSHSNEGSYPHLGPTLQLTAMPGP